MSLISSLAAPNETGGARKLLKEMSEKYESLQRYDFKGSQVLNLADVGCELAFPVEIAGNREGADELFLPSIFFASPKLTGSCRNFVANRSPLQTPSSWARFTSVDVGENQVRNLGTRVLRLPTKDIRCFLVAIQYDEYTQKLKGVAGPVTYWIDANTKLVRRVEFQQPEPERNLSWIVTIENVEMGGSPAPWLAKRTSFASKSQGLVGKPAPDFQLVDTNGDTVELAALRGKIVLLDFWATWCGACTEEIPFLEKLAAAEDPAKLVVLGISDEDKATVLGWLQENRRPFRTLVGAQKTFHEFGVEPIPTLVVVNREGIVEKVVVGFVSEQRFRQLVNQAIAQAR